MQLSKAVETIASVFRVLAQWYDRANASLAPLFGEPAYNLLWAPPILVILAILVMINNFCCWRAP